MIWHGTIDTTILISSADLGQITRGQPADDLLAITVEEVSFSGTSNRTLHSMILCGRNSDLWHRGEQRIFFHSFAHTSLKLI